MNDEELYELRESLELIVESLRTCIEAYEEIVSTSEDEYSRLTEGPMTAFDIEEAELHAENIALHRRFVSLNERRIAVCQSDLDQVNASVSDRAVKPPPPNPDGTSESN